jgi:2-oxoglutarate ferredoxin oxidoreductase subunit beta
MGYPYETISAIDAAIRTKGFGFVEILAPCPTGFGKTNEQREATDSWEWDKENTSTRAELAALDPEKRKENTKIVIGTLWQDEKPEFCKRYADLVERLQREEAEAGV